MKDKYKNYSFWTALAGAVVIFLNALGDCFGFSIDNELVSGLIMSFAGLLVVFGIVTMPTNDKNGEMNIGNNEQEDLNKEQEKKNISVEEEVEKDEDSQEDRVLKEKEE